MITILLEPFCVRLVDQQSLCCTKTVENNIDVIDKPLSVSENQIFIEIIIGDKTYRIESYELLVINTTLRLKLAPCRCNSASFDRFIWFLLFFKHNTCGEWKTFHEIIEFYSFPICDSNRNFKFSTHSINIQWKIG